MVTGWRKLLAYFLAIFMPISSMNLSWLTTSAAVNMVVVATAYAQSQQQIDQYNNAIKAGKQNGSIPLPGSIPNAINSAIAPGEQCVMTSRQCVEGPETRIINTKKVYRDCWRYADSLACTVSNSLEDSKCADLRAQGCYETKLTCRAYSQADPTYCVQWEKIYKCPIQNPNVSVQASCAQTGFCMDGNCFANDYEPNNDFGKAAATLEMAREAGKYLDPNTMTFFHGEEDSCREGWGGIRKCCDKKVSPGQSNKGVAQQIGISAIWQGAKWGWNYLVENLSPYVYDSMFQSGMPWLEQKGFEGLQKIEQASLLEGPPVPSFTPSLSYAGLTVSYGPMVGGQGALSSLFGPGMEVANSGNFYIYFNPTLFALFVAIMIFQMLSSCEQDEMILSVKRGQDLCYANGSECSTKSFFGCAETRFKFCCFNSKIARIINEQGRPQLGKPIPGDCGGFSVQELNNLDFSKIDLSEFYNDLVPDATTMQSGTWTNRAKNRVDAGATFKTPDLSKRPK